MLIGLAYGVAGFHKIEDIEEKLKLH